MVAASGEAVNVEVTLVFLKPATGTGSLESLLLFGEIQASSILAIAVCALAATP